MLGNSVRRTSRQAEMIGEEIPTSYFSWTGKIGIHPRPPVGLGLRRRFGNLVNVVCPASSQTETIVEAIPTKLLTLRGRFGKLADLAPKEKRPYSEWKIYQGEIFTGTLNIHRLVEDQKVKLTFAHFLVFNGQDADVKVAVKVSSKAVHYCLTDPEQAWNALHSIYISKYLSPALDSMPPKLDDVLLAVYSTPIGLITIMKDLTEEDYNVLRPSAYKDNLLTLWAAFIELLRNVLIPMAKLKFIHPDIRPGYDETSNVLWKFNDEADKSKGAIMKLIDFESIVRYDDWRAPDGSQSLYIRRENNWNTATFLWWQCVAVAFAWHCGKTQKEMATFGLNNLQNVVRQFESGDSHQHLWLKGFYPPLNFRKPAREMDFYLLDNLTKVFLVVDEFNFNKEMEPAGSNVKGSLFAQWRKGEKGEVTMDISPHGANQLLQGV
jgi:hypothetical protein